MKNRNNLPALLTCCAMLLMSSCVSQKQSMINQGFPRPYADGFDEGCHSGKQAGGNMFEQFRKDTRRFASDNQYAQGWSDGFRQCETEEESMQRQTRMNIEQQHYMEEKQHYKWEDQHHLDTELLQGIDTSGLGNLK